MTIGSGGTVLSVTIIRPPQPMSKHTRWVIAVVVAMAISICSLGVANAALPKGNGDPGDHILRSLARISRAVPAGAKSYGVSTAEPDWIASCTDQDFKKGWSMVDYEIGFQTMESKSQVVAEVTKKMASLGWGRVAPNLGGGWIWRSRLATGHEAQANLTAPFEGELAAFCHVKSP